MDYLSVIIRFLMLSSWLLTISLSIYLTISRHLIKQDLFNKYMLILIGFAILSTILSLIYMKYVSPLKASIDEWNDLVEGDEDSN